MQGLYPTCIRQKERNHHEQSNKPRTYHKGVPTCRGIKNRCRRRGGKPFQPPLPAARHPRHKAVASLTIDYNGKRLTLLCDARKKSAPTAQHTKQYTKTFSSLLNKTDLS